MDRAGGLVAVRAEKAQHARAKGPLAAQYEETFHVISQLHAALHASGHDTASIRGLADRCLNKVRAWGSDSGASCRVLDHRLRRASKLLSVALELLRELHELVSHVVDSLPYNYDGFGDPPFRFYGLRPPPGSSTAPSSSSAVPAHDSDLIDIIGIPDPDGDGRPEQYLEAAEDVVDGLVRLLPDLLQPQDDTLLEPVLNADQLAAQDRKEIKMAFPSCEDYLVERMVQQNGLRRQRVLVSREDAPTPDTAPGASEEPKGTSSTPSPPKCSHVTHPPFRGYRKVRTSTQSESEGDVSKDAPSTYNTSVFTNGTAKELDSVTSFESPSGIVTVLEPPKAPVNLVTEQALIPFTCPYCSFEVPLGPGTYFNMDEEEWVEHVYLDLQPYTCTFKECAHATQCFGAKHDWFQHELNSHRSHVAWLCGKTECQSSPWFQSPADFERHVQILHQDLLEREDICTLLENCKRVSPHLIRQESCPFCRASFKDTDGAPEWRDHIAHHMEQIALRVLGEDEEPLESEPVRSELINEFVSEQKEILQASINSPAGRTSAGETTSVGGSIDQGLTDSFGSEKAAANTLWQGKVEDFFEKQDGGDVAADAGDAEAEEEDTTWHSMPARNKEFVGRTHDLEDLHEYVAEPGHICVVSGRGGIGKTATTVEYSYRFADSFSLIIWLEAETSGRLSERYNRIGKVLGLGDEEDPMSMTLTIRESLGMWDKRWLLVFDNVEAWEEVSKYIPRNLPTTKGSVLITTRKQDLIEAHTPALRTVLHRHDLAPLTSEESTQFLLCAANPKLPLEEVKSHPDYDLALLASNKVERLPLSLSMIAGYLEESRASLDDFLEIWDEKQAFRRKQAGRSKLVVEGALDSSIDLLWDIGIMELAVPARNLLEILAFLDPESIPQSLLVGDHQEEYLEFLNSTETSMYKRMIRRLSARKLIDVRTDKAGGQAYRIHRLLQRKIIMDIGSQLKFDSAMTKATRLVRKAFPHAPVLQMPAPHNWDQSRKHMPHVSSLLRAFRDAEELIKEFVRTPELAELFYDAGFYAWDRQAAEYNGLSFLTASERILDYIGADENHHLRADIHCMAGLLLNSAGCEKRDESLRRLELARAIRDHIYEADPTKDNDILLRNAATDLGILLLNNYRFSEAEFLFDSCLRRYGEWGTEETIPFEYSKYYYNMGIVRLWQGRLDDSIQYLQRSVDLAEAAFGKEGQYWDNLFMLACAVMQTGDTRRALELHIATLEACLQRVGKHSRSTIMSLYAVGGTYATHGDVLAAIEYMERAIAVAVSSGNWTEEAIARARFRLSLLYDREDLFPEAAKDLRAQSLEVLDKYRQYVTPWVLATGDERMMFDDLQPTDDGRFVGRHLMSALWSRREADEGKRRQDAEESKAATVVSSR